MSLGIAFENLLQKVQNSEVTAVVTNSKKTVPGSVFVAISGFKTDGHIYIPEALASGSRYVVVEKDLGLPNQVLVRNSREALAKLSHAFYDNPSHKLNLIGVTGTNGKTSTAYMLYHVLKEKAGLFSTVKTMVGESELSQDRTTPEVLEIDDLLCHMLKNGANYAVMEVSSHSVVLDRVLDLRFVGGIFTNLSQDHLDFHKTMEAYAKAKQEFFNMMPAESVAAFNRDDPSVNFMAAKYIGRKIGFGVNNGEIRATNIEATATTIGYDLVVGKKKWEVKLPIGGEFNVYNSLGVLALLHGMDFGMEEAIRKLETFPGVPGRFEKVDLGQDFAVIVDYAHTPDGLENVLSSAAKQVRGKGDLTVVFGCGGDRDKTKRPKMGKVVSTWADKIIVTSDNPRTEDPNLIIKDILPGIEGKPYLVEADRKNAIFLALSEAKPSDMIVIAGKGHEDYQEINGAKYHFDDREVAREGLIFFGKNQR